MPGFKNISVDLIDGILMIIINRVEKLNALNFKTLEEIKVAIQKAYDEIEVKAVIFTGAGENSLVAPPYFTVVEGIQIVAAPQNIDAGRSQHRAGGEWKGPGEAAIEG